MPSGWYNTGIYEITSGTTVWTSATIKVMLMNTLHAFDRDDEFVSDIVANEISASGYSRQTLASKTVANDATKDATYMDAGNPNFGVIVTGQTVRFMVMYRDTGDDATSPLLACWQVIDQATNGTSIVFPFNPNGVSKNWSAT